MNEANWWLCFLRARKRSDRIKMELLFLIAGFYFLGSTVFSGITFYRENDILTEYVFGGSLYGKLLEEEKEIVAAGMQKESMVELDFLWETMTFRCVELPESYLRVVYGISESSSMTVFYVNQAALDQIKQSWKKNSGKTFELNELYPEYTLDESRSGMAKIMVLPQWVKEDTPYVCCKADSTQLNDSAQVRICMKKRDFDQRITKWLFGLGLELEDIDKKQIEDMENENRFLRIKYEILVMALCFLSAFCLQKFGRKDET